jgi:hypothetical protein
MKLKYYGYTCRITTSLIAKTTESSPNQSNQISNAWIIIDEIKTNILFGLL